MPDPLLSVLATVIRDHREAFGPWYDDQLHCTCDAWSQPYEHSRSAPKFATSLGARHDRRQIGRAHV